MRLKITLLALSLAAATAAYATDTYNYTFEDAASTPTSSISGWVQDGTLNVVDNTVTDGINPSAKCLTFQAQSGIEWWGGIFVNMPSTITTTTTNRYVYMKIRTESSFNTNFTIELFNSDTEGNVYGATPSTMLNTAWQEFCFMIPAGQTFTKIRVQPRHAGNIYIDDVRLSDVAPAIPNLSAYTCDFEAESSKANWTSNFTGKGSVSWVSTTTEAPLNGATVANSSAHCLKVWVENGGYSEYGGGRFTGLYGYTTEQTRYLHVRYYFLSNEDHSNQYNLPLWVFTEDGDSHHDSAECYKNQWNDVTIDLGVGTLVKYLNFTVNDYWVNLGIDDIQLDGNATTRDSGILTGIASAQSGSVKIIADHGALRLAGVTEPCMVSVYGMTGIQNAVQSVNTDTSIFLQPGFYIVKVQSASNTQVQKIVIK